MPSLPDTVAPEPGMVRNVSESDDVYAGGFLGESQLDPSETLTGDNTNDPLDPGYNPPDRPSHSWRGDTAEEQREGESLDQHLAEEEPEVWEGDVDDVEPETLLAQADAAMFAYKRARAAG